MVRGDDGGVSRVEFVVDDAGDVPDATRTALRARAASVIALAGRRRFAAQVVVLVGALGAAASVFLPQLVFHFVGPARFELDGLGHFRTLVADPHVQLAGHGPPLGAVALIAGILLAIVICADWIVRWRFADIAQSALVGVVAGAFACQSVEATGWPNWSWSYGWWLFGASTLCVVAGGISVHLSGRVDTGDRTGRRSSGSS